MVPYCRGIHGLAARLDADRAVSRQGPPLRMEPGEATEVEVAGCSEGALQSMAGQERSGPSCSLMLTNVGAAMRLRRNPGEAHAHHHARQVRHAVRPRPVARAARRLPASPAEIDAEVDAALVRFYEEVPAAKELAKKAKGILIFPQVVKAGSGLAASTARARSGSAANRSATTTPRPARSAPDRRPGPRRVLMFMTRRRSIASAPAMAGRSGSAAGHGGQDRSRRRDRHDQYRRPGDRVHLRRAGLMASQPRGRQDHQDGQVWEALGGTASGHRFPGRCRAPSRAAGAHEGPSRRRYLARGGKAARDVGRSR